MSRTPAHPRHLHDLLQIRGPFGDCGDHPQTSVECLGTWRCRALGVHGSQIRQRPCFGETTGTHPTQVSDRKSTRLNSSHVAISYAVFCLKKKITNSTSV